MAADETQWDFWRDLLVEYSRIYLRWLSSASYRDLERGLWTATSVNVECLRLSLLRACVREDLRSLIYLSLDPRYQITANSEDEVIVTSLWKPIPNSNVQAQLIWCGWIGADTVLEFNMPRFDQRIQQVGNLWLDLIKIALAGLCLARCLLWWGSRYWHAYWLVWLHIYWMEDSALSGCVNIPSICICHRT